MATLKDQSATSALNEDKYINKNFDTILGSQKDTIKKNYESSGKQLASGQDATQKLTDAYLDRTRVESPMSSGGGYVPMSGGMKAAGIGAQAALSFGNQNQKNISALKQQQSFVDQEFERQRKLLADKYSTAIKQAQADNDMARAQQLYEAAKAEEEQLRGLRQEAANLMAGKDDMSIVDSIVNGDPIQRDTQSETWDSVLKNEDSINKIYDAMIQSQQLEAQQETAKQLSDMMASQEAAQRATDQKLSAAYVDALRSAKNYRDVQTAYGQGSGTAIQAQIARDNALTEDLTNLRTLQAGKDAEVEMDRLGVIDAYNDRISKIQQDANLKRVQDLYKAAEEEEQNLIKDQLFAGGLLADKENDYSVLGKLYGLTQAQIDRLQGTGEYAPVYNDSQPPKKYGSGTPGKKPVPDKGTGGKLPVTGNDFTDIWQNTPVYNKPNIIFRVP